MPEALQPLGLWWDVWRVGKAGGKRATDWRSLWPRQEQVLGSDSCRVQEDTERGPMANISLREGGTGCLCPQPPEGKTWESKQITELADPVTANGGQGKGPTSSHERSSPRGREGWEGNLRTVPNSLTMGITATRTPSRGCRLAGSDVWPCGAEASMRRVWTRKQFNILKIQAMQLSVKDN